MSDMLVSMELYGVMKTYMSLCSQIDLSYNNFSEKSAPPACRDSL